MSPGPWRRPGTHTPRAILVGRLQRLGTPGLSGRGYSLPSSHSVSPDESPYMRLLASHIDGKLSARLLGDNVWLARLRLRARRRESKAGADVDDVLSTLVNIHYVDGDPVYATFRVKDSELRVLAVDHRVGVALLRGDGGLTGRLALEEALKLPRGQAVVYVLRTPLPQ